MAAVRGSLKSQGSSVEAVTGTTVVPVAMNGRLQLASSHRTHTRARTLHPITSIECTPPRTQGEPLEGTKDRCRPARPFSRTWMVVRMLACAGAASTIYTLNTQHTTPPTQPNPRRAKLPEELAPFLCDPPPPPADQEEEDADAALAASEPSGPVPGHGLPLVHVRGRVCSLRMLGRAMLFFDLVDKSVQP